MPRIVNHVEFSTETGRPGNQTSAKATTWDAEILSAIKASGEAYPNGDGSSNDPSLRALTAAVKTYAANAGISLGDALTRVAGFLKSNLSAYIAMVPGGASFAEFLARVSPLDVSFSESHAPSFTAPGGYSVDPERLALHQRSLKVQAVMGCSYEDALRYL